MEERGYKRQGREGKEEREEKGGMIPPTAIPGSATRYKLRVSYTSSHENSCRCVTISTPCLKMTYALYKQPLLT